MVKHTKVKIEDGKFSFVKVKVTGPGILCLLGFHKMRTDASSKTHRVFNLGNKRSMEVTFRCIRDNCNHTEAKFFEILE